MGGGRILFLATFFLFFATHISSAQRPERQLLSSFTPMQQTELADLIMEFLQQNSHVFTQHAQLFGQGIHDSNNFFPWHRVHIQMLEQFLTEKGKKEYIPLPKWNPSMPIPTTFIRDAINPNVPSNIDPTKHNVPIPSNIQDCSIKDAGAFEDAVEDWHDGVHCAVNDAFCDFQSTAATLIFWPWHAFVDDMWYNWERDCQGSFTLWDEKNHIITISDDTKICEETWVKGIISVEDGATLTICANTKVHFLETRYNAYPTRIEVKPGGRLVVEKDATLTGIQELGSIGRDGPKGTAPFGIYYNSHWDGIKVFEEKGKIGRVNLHDGATIEDAAVGVYVEGATNLIATGANFKNNRISVQIEGKQKKNLIQLFSNCKFWNTYAIRDNAWTTELSNGSSEEAHIDHALSHNSLYHVCLNEARKPTFANCNFTNNYFDPHKNYHTIGLFSRSSTFAVNGGTFDALYQGIAGGNLLPGFTAVATIHNATFKRTCYNIILKRCDYSSITQNKIDISNIPFDTYHGLGIFTIETAGYDI